MAYLGKYIKQLLQKKEDVILPGFGSLKVVKSVGDTDEQGVLQPPGLIVKLDAEHPKDDGKLAALYAENEGLSQDEAHQQVLELVDAIKFRLDKGETFELEDLGKFSRDNDNRIHFFKDEEWVLDKHSFGLEPLELIELDDEEAQSENAEDQHKKTVEILLEEGEEKARDEKKNPVNKWKIIWMVVAGLIVVLVTLLMIPSGSDGIRFNRDGIVIRDDDSNKTEISDPKPIEKKPEIIDKQESDNLEQEESTSDDKPMETVTKYYIISGSFQNLINASEMRDKLVSQGFPAEIIYTENRLYRVSIKSYFSKEAANNELPTIKRESGIDRAWILAR